MRPKGWKTSLFGTCRRLLFEHLEEPDDNHCQPGKNGNDDRDTGQREDAAEPKEQITFASSSFSIG